MARGWDRINLNVIFFFFFRGREFFVLHRMVGRTQRGVLTPAYFEPCNFPSLLIAGQANKLTDDELLGQTNSDFSCKASRLKMD